MRHVAILIETSRAYGRGAIRGVARYNREHGHWSTWFRPQGLGDAPPPWLVRWKGDGIIARIENLAMARAIARVGVPVVNLRGNLPELTFPFIGADNHAVAQLAAEHLLERGFRHLALYAYRHGFHPGMGLRCDVFRKLVESAGCPCAVLRAPDAGQDATWERQQRRLAAWIRSLPRPLGLLAINDELGLQVLDACRRIPVRVPDDVAVISVDNDEYLCELAIPPLTSIDLNSEQAGYEAAVLLDRLMKRKPLPAKLPSIQPLGVVTRRSTDVLAVEDEQVIAAVRFIRENAFKAIRERDVSAHAKSSGTSLRTRVRQVLGRSIHQEIKRVQLEKAKTLLSTTNMPIKQVAGVAGFKTVQYLTRVFRASTGHTPAAFRRQRGL
jgi:LacI family transcriptional regulator